MDRRKFLKRMGIGGAGVIGVGATAGAYAYGDHRGREREVGAFRSSVVAGQGVGDARVWWSVSTEEKVLALTFDDGPTEQFTGSVLDVLDRYAVPASFFLIGEMVHRRPDDVRRAIAAGHEVANHTFDHISAAELTGDEVRRSMELGADAVAEITGDRPRWFRPVKGFLTGAVVRGAADLGHDIAIWTYGRGPERGSPDELAPDDADGVGRYMAEQVQPGAIALLHDGIGRSAFEWTGPDEGLITARRAELEALPGVIERYLDDGFRFLTVTDLIDGYGV